MTGPVQVKRRVLICDGEPAIVRMVGKLLAFDSFEVTAMSDPQAVIPALVRSPHDLVILDLLMPGMDGTAIIEALRRREDALRDVRVIVLTAKLLSIGERAALRRAGVTIVEKPLRIDAFIQTVRHSIAGDGER